MGWSRRRGWMGTVRERARRLVHLTASHRYRRRRVEPGRSFRPHPQPCRPTADTAADRTASSNSQTAARAPIRRAWSVRLVNARARLAASDQFAPPGVAVPQSTPPGLAVPQSAPTPADHSPPLPGRRCILSTPTWPALESHPTGTPRTERRPTDLPDQRQRPHPLLARLTEAAPGMSSRHPGIHRSRRSPSALYENRPVGKGAIGSPLSATPEN